MSVSEKKSAFATEYSHFNPNNVNHYRVYHSPCSICNRFRSIITFSLKKKTVTRNRYFRYQSSYKSFANDLFFYSKKNIRSKLHRELWVKNMWSYGLLKMTQQHNSWLWQRFFELDFSLCYCGVYVFIVLLC